MTESITPWTEIKTPDQDYNVRKVGHESCMEMFWGKDSNNCCLFLIGLQGDLADQFQNEKVTIHGVSTDLRLLESIGAQFFVLRLERKIDLDLFYALCNTIIEAVASIEDSSILLNVIFKHLKRWKAFLAGRSLRILSVEEQRGLFCEVKFLQELIRLFNNEMAALEAWHGPDRQQQDFLYFDRAVEIKSLYGNTRNAVHISSEDQLETVCPKLFLCVYRLAERSPSDHSISLNDLIRNVYSSLTDDNAIELFSDKLAAVGYAEIREYDNPALTLTGIKVFLVGDEFPRLVRSDLPGAILKVSYDLQLQEIAVHECLAEELWRPPDE